MDSHKNTYGWARAEVLGALVNSVFLIALCFTIFVEAIQRLTHMHEIKHTDWMLYVGIAGLVINVVGLVLFHQHSHGGHGHSHGHGGRHRKSRSSPKLQAKNSKGWITNWCVSNDHTVACMHTRGFRTGQLITVTRNSKVRQILQGSCASLEQSLNFNLKSPLIVLEKEWKALKSLEFVYLTVRTYCHSCPSLPFPLLIPPPLYGRRTA